MKRKNLLDKIANVTMSALVVFSLIPSKGFAAIGGPIFGGCELNDPGSLGDKTGTTELQCVVTQVTNWSLGIIGAIIVLIIIIAGVRYILSAGNPTQTEGAKKTLVGAIIGLIIVMLSKLIIQLVISVMTGTS